MPANAQQEMGHLYKAEKPSSYNKGQTGKGVSIKGKVTAMKGSAFPTGGDKQAGVLKKLWGKAMNAKSKFGNF